MNATPENDLLTPNEAARRVRCHVATVYRWILSGKLPAVRRGGSRYLVKGDDLAALLCPVAPLKLSTPRPSTGKAQAWAEDVLRKSGFMR